MPKKKFMISVRKSLHFGTNQESSEQDSCGRNAFLCNNSNNTSPGVGSDVAASLKVFRQNLEGQKIPREQQYIPR